MKEKQPEFRPLIGKGSKIKPVKELFNGFEIEKKWILMTMEEDHTKAKNGLVMYDKALQKGDIYNQGYIKDMFKAKEVIDELGIEVEFQPNTIRLRKIGNNIFILTLKDKKATKTREAEFELSRQQYAKYWPLTKGARVQKKRWTTTIKGYEMVIDAFTDRFLLMAECEVQDEAIMDKLPKLGNDVTGNKEWSNKSLSR